MPTPRPPQITAWSFSRWNDYEKCPFLAKCKHVDKIKEPGNAAMDRGTDIHTLAEKYANGKLEKMPEELSSFTEEFKELVAAEPQCEQDWAFTAQWVRTGWFDRNAWLRVKMDAHYVEQKSNSLIVIDHKTGKPKPDEHKMQLELYTLSSMLMYPEVGTVVAKLWYLDHGTEEVFVTKNIPKELERLKKLWLTRTRAMLSDTRFAPRPGKHCGWCFFRASNGGPCQY